jgi:hypothetical protein
MSRNVLVTFHARKRAEERCGIGVGLVAHEVRRAIADGRMAVHQPRWACDGDHARRRADRSKSNSPHGQRLRWVWPFEESRAYLVRERGGRWIVITVVAAPEQAAA